jgi:DNA-binding beta-propeller fold protein YncE
MPRFEVDPSWPHIPNGWTLGQVASVAADAKSHIWVLQRPRTIRPGEHTGPPVLEFDEQGQYIMGWGGPGPGYDWPQSEHGIYIDDQGYVWIVGSGNDDQVLKFTSTGQFVLQIGHPRPAKSNRDTTQFWKPTDLAVSPATHEVFISDGYGNRRVVVFDAMTGKFVRMWGAFGHPPEDSPIVGEGGAKAHASEPADRIPAKNLSADDPGPPQLDTVHGLKLSHDNLIYVADRGGKRVQVFTTAGKYVQQVFVDRWCEAPGGSNAFCGNGQTASSVAFSSDPEQRFLYVASRSPDRIWVFDRKTLAPLTRFGRPGVAPGEFYALHEIATDSEGNLYTAEVEDARRVQKFVFKGIVTAPTDSGALIDER